MTFEATPLTDDEKQDRDRAFELACKGAFDQPDDLFADTEAANKEALRVNEHNLAHGYHEIVIDYDAIEAQHLAENGFNYTDGDENNYAPDDDDFEPSRREYSAEGEEPAKGVIGGPDNVDMTTPNHFEIGINVSGEYIPPDDLIDGIFTRTSRNGIVGATGSGKSFVIGEIAYAVITGKPFAGHDVLRRGGFAYFSYEGSGTIDARWRGLQMRHDDDFKDLPFFPCRQPLLLNDDAGWKALRKTVKRMESISWDRFDRPLVAVAVDTVHASQMVLKENDAGEWARPLNWMKEISEEFKLAFIVAHHSGKSQDTPDGKTADGSLWRGSGAAPAALDNILAVKMDKREGSVSRRWMFQEKSKDGETGYIADIETKVHVIGRKRNGKPATTLTLDFNRKTADDIKAERAQDAKAKAEAKAAAKGPAKRTKYEEIAMQAIRIVAQKEERAVELTEGGWSFTASIKEVEDKAKELSEKDGNFSRDFPKAISKLTSNGELEIDGPRSAYGLKVKPVVKPAFTYNP